MPGIVRPRFPLLLVTAAGCLFAAAGGLMAYRAAFGRAVSPRAELKAHVRSLPPVPVVFTSRSNVASFRAAAPEADGFAFPGTIPWAADEGRLRLLDADGDVYELTWDRALPDGSKLIDAMSPTVSLDGTFVLFAGRKGPPDPGRWRIYRVGVDGRGLEQLTGGPDDPGCIVVPPLRYAADGSTMPAEDRKRLDYDDVDPTDCGEAGIAFASSRIPDLGRDHSRRATQLWLLPPGGVAPRPLTANRNNDRWPFLASGNLLLFSMWSRNREAVTRDRTDVRPVAEGHAFRTAPTDLWMGARVMPDGSQLGYAVKVPEPVWRLRPLFNGRVAFMTAADGSDRYRIAQADWGHLRIAPSSSVGGEPLPAQRRGELRYGPDRDADGRALSVGCPSPCPTGGVLCSAARSEGRETDYGLYLTGDDWATPPIPRLLFDDPAMVDAEPVAAYARAVATHPAEPPVMPEAMRPEALALADGTRYRGAMGLLENSIINAPMPDPFPGQLTDAGAGPVVPHPTGVRSVAVYAARRDRFDDPVSPRIPGTWEKLLAVPLSGGSAFRAWVPADPITPTVLAGLGADGRVFEWASSAADAAGRSAALLAVAGDHYSGTRPNGYHFCVGCHTGHTFIATDVRERER